MSRQRSAVLRLGDRVRFDGAVHTVSGVSGTTVRLVSAAGYVCAVLLPHLLADADFELLEGAPSARVPPVTLLEGLPTPVADKARAWERHVVEVDTGLLPDAVAGARPRPQYDPRHHLLAARVRAKAAELGVSPATVQRMRTAYQRQGLWGLVDHRRSRQSNPFGRADPRLIAAIAAAVEREKDASTGTRKRLRLRVEEALTTEYGAGTVAMPSAATFYRLAAALSEGQHTFGAATTRRSQANRPDGPFTASWAMRPGEQVQIDTTPLDVMVVLDDGVLGRPELTIAVDVASRTICAAVLRPVGTKAVDAALLLAKMLVPEPMRLGWPDSLAMRHSAIPHQRLVGLDDRLAHAAAKPVIVPDTIVCDRGRIYLSRVFLTACQSLGVSVQPCHPRSPAEKGVVERTFESINSLFCQYVAGYTGRDAAHRGTRVEDDAVWTLSQLQDLLDEWIIQWQNRPHDGLRNPHQPERALSPNEMYAALVAAAGYLPLPLTGSDYLELLPTHWRTINDYGIRIDHRTYDTSELNPLRRQHSGIDAQRGLWEVHYDPYDLSQVWVRDQRGKRWITATWTHLPMVRAPFADFTWRQAREIVAARQQDDTDQSEVARVLAELLARAGTGPAWHQRASARQAAAPSVLPPSVRPELAEPEHHELPDDVVPFGVFDPFEEGNRW